MPPGPLAAPARARRAVACGSRSRTISPTTLVAALLGAVVACGGASAVNVTPTTPEQRRVLDHGVDFVEDPEVLEGQWRQDWSRELELRISAADIVAIVDVLSIQTSRIPDQGNAIRVHVRRQRALLPSDPPEEFDLVVPEGEGGYNLVYRNQPRLLRGQHVLFAKWYRDDQQALQLHWHLSPATDPVVRRVEYLVDRRRNAPTETRRVVRTQ
jgi:hypothetical protein